jgi:transposase
VAEHITGPVFVAVKSEQQQAAGLVFRTRDLLVRQRTQLINAIRGHLTEYGWIAPKGPSHVAMLADLLEEEEMVNSLPEAARAMFRLMLDLLAGLDGKIADLDKEIARRAREDEVSRRLPRSPPWRRRPRPLPRPRLRRLARSHLFKDPQVASKSSA